MSVPHSSSLLQRGRPRPGPVPPPTALTLWVLSPSPSLEGGVTEELAAWERAQTLPAVPKAPAVPTPACPCSVLKGEKGEGQER